MRRGHLRLVAVLPVLMTLILLSFIQSSIVQPSYASEQEEGVRTFRIKAYLENSVVEHENKETIHFQVADHKTHQPIGGAITSATVSYADGKTVRYFSVPTDASVRSSISWRIEQDAPDGRYNVAYSVSEPGYEPAYFGGSFSVVENSVNYGCLSSASASASVSASAYSSCSAYSSSPSSSSPSSSSPSSSSPSSSSPSSSSPSSSSPSSSSPSSSSPSSSSPSSSSPSSSLPSSSLPSSSSPSSSLPSSSLPSSSLPSSSSPFEPPLLFMDIGGSSNHLASSDSIKPIKSSATDLGSPSTQIASPIKSSATDLGGPSTQIASPIKSSATDLGGPSTQIASSQPIKPSPNK